LAKRKLSFSNNLRNKNPNLPTYQSSANLWSSLTKKTTCFGFSWKQQASNNGPKFIPRQTKVAVEEEEAK